MAPNKGWMRYSKHDRLNPAYCDGVERFLKFAFAREGDSLNVRCPCVKCKNRKNFTLDEIRIHLLAYGIMMTYNIWYHHGENFGEEEDAIEVTSESDEDEDEDEDSLKFIELEADKDMHDLLSDVFHKFTSPTRCSLDDDLTEYGNHDNPLVDNAFEEALNEDSKKFYSSMNDLKEALYPGSRTSKLSALVKLLHIKSIGHWSNKSFTSLLQFLKEDLLPIGSTLPDSYDEAKKIIHNLGLQYHKIDACQNNCMLFWKEDKDANFCKVCGISRWKNTQQDEKLEQKSSGKNVANKTLRYFPLTPRLQRRFMSKKTSPDMRWHFERRSQTKKMSHPADSEAWKWVDA